MHEWLIDKIIPSVGLGVGAFVVAFLRRLLASILELNVKMAVFVEKITAIAEHVDDHESRLRDLETSRD